MSSAAFLEPVAAAVRSVAIEDGAAALAQVLARHSLDPRETEEARRLLDIEVVSLASQRSTLSDIEMLLAQCAYASKALARGGYTADIASAFHLALADSTHNRAISLLVRALQARSTPAGRRGNLRCAQRDLREHRAIVEALRDHDEAAARAVMAAHLARKPLCVAPTSV